MEPFLVIALGIISIVGQLNNYGIDAEKHPHLKHVRVRREANQPYPLEPNDQNAVTKHADTPPKVGTASEVSIKSILKGDFNFNRQKREAFTPKYVNTVYYNPNQAYNSYNQDYNVNGYDLANNDNGYNQGLNRNAYNQPYGGMSYNQENSRNSYNGNGYNGNGYNGNSYNGNGYNGNGYNKPYNSNEHNAILSPLAVPTATPRYSNVYKPAVINAFSTINNNTYNGYVTNGYKTEPNKYNVNTVTEPYNGFTQRYPSNYNNINENTTIKKDNTRYNYPTNFNTGNGLYNANNGPNGSYNSSRGTYNGANGTYNGANWTYNDTNWLYNGAGGAYNSNNGSYNGTNWLYNGTNWLYNSTNGLYNSTNGSYNGGNGSYNVTNELSTTSTTTWNPVKSQIIINLRCPQFMMNVKIMGHSICIPEKNEEIKQGGDIDDDYE